MNNSLYDAQSTANENSLQLWHARYGHLAFKSLNSLNNQNLVADLNFNNSDEVEFVRAARKESKEGVHFQKMKPLEPKSCHRLFILMSMDQQRLKVLVEIVIWDTH